MTKKNTCKRCIREQNMEPHDTRGWEVLWRFTTGHCEAQSRRPHCRTKTERGYSEQQPGTRRSIFYFMKWFLSPPTPSPPRTRVMKTQIANLSSILNLRGLSSNFTSDKLSTSPSPSFVFFRRWEKRPWDLCGPKTHWANKRECRASERRLQQKGENHCNSLSVTHTHTHTSSPFLLLSPSSPTSLCFHHTRSVELLQCSTVTMMF